MNYYRSLVGGSSGNLKAASYTAIVNNAYQLGSCDQAFSNNATFNDEVTIGDRVFSCNQMLYNCTNFNQNVIIPENVKYCYGMFEGCTNFNNKNIIIPANVEVCAHMFMGIPNLRLNMWINGTNPLNYVFTVYTNGAHARKNIYCSDYSIVYNIYGWNISWYNGTNYKYNTEYNIYIYNNYSV